MTHFEIDRQKIKDEACYDGKCVVRTHMDDPSPEKGALQGTLDGGRLHPQHQDFG
jgi:hypothetical protein